MDKNTAIAFRSNLYRAEFITDMDERTQVAVGLALLVIGSVIVFLYGLPSIVAVPAVVAVLAALGMSAGTLLVGTSEEAV